MDKRKLSLLFAATAMIAASGGAVAMKPRELMARSQAELNLETAIPTAFGSWREAPGIRLVEPPAPGSLEREIYNQEVARGYVDPDGHVVMFLIAYGESQSERLQLHRPEVCYAAQGFAVSRPQDALLTYGEGSQGMAIRRLVTRREQRLEPITYWMRIGNDVSEGVLERQWLKLTYGLRGLVPDGALFRVSTVGIPEKDAFEIQQRFIRDLISDASPQLKTFMVGSPDRAFITR